MSRFVLIVGSSSEDLPCLYIVNGVLYIWEMIIKGETATVGPSFFIIQEKTLVYALPHVATKSG